HGPLTITERIESYGVTSMLMYGDPFHAAFEGGESIWGVKNDRIRNLMSTWAREQDGKRILVVAHGDLIRAARGGFERIITEELYPKNLKLLKVTLFIRLKTVRFWNIPESTRSQEKMKAKLSGGELLTPQNLKHRLIMGSG